MSTTIMQLVNFMFLGECVLGGKVEYMNERELPLRSNHEQLACDSVDCHLLVDDLMTFPLIVHKRVTFL